MFDYSQRTSGHSLNATENLLYIERRGRNT